MSSRPNEVTKLSEQYGVEAAHEDDLQRQFEQVAAFEKAADSGDWKLFRRIVNQSGKVFLQPMRSSDGDPRLRLPLFQSGELEERFTGSLQYLNKNWTHLMPWWARFGYRFEVALTFVTAGLMLGAISAAAAGSPGFGAIFGAAALASLVVMDNAEPGVRSYSRWWVRLIYPKPRSIPSGWRTAGYVVATLMVMWFMLAPTFKTTGDFCDGLSPEELAVYQGCLEAQLK